MTVQGAFLKMVSETDAPIILARPDFSPDDPTMMQSASSLSAAKRMVSCGSPASSKVAISTPISDARIFARPRTRMPFLMFLSLSSWAFGTDDIHDEESAPERLGVSERELDGLLGMGLPICTNYDVHRDRPNYC